MNRAVLYNKRLLESRLSAIISDCLEAYRKGRVPKRPLRQDAVRRIMQAVSEHNAKEAGCGQCDYS